MAHGARNVIYGVSDPGYANWPTLETRTAELGIHQIAAWPAYDCAGSFPDLKVPIWQPVLAVLSGPASCAPASALERRLYVRAVLSFVRRSPNVREIQVWNEPDLGEFWRWQAPVGSYVLLLAGIHDALRATGVKVLGPGFSPHGIYDNPGVNFGVSAFATAVRDFTSRPVGPVPCWTATRTTRTGASTKLRPGGRHVSSTHTGRGCRSAHHGAGFGSGGRRRERGANSAAARLDEGDGDPDFQAQRVRIIARRAYRDPLVVASFNYLLVDAPCWKGGLFYEDGGPKPALLRVPRRDQVDR
jgi:hypothetical protein